ncbi:MAG: carbohydrate kinase [Acidobacteriaceae bacterium]|nr:carbohydrate kinase [Acidobacteriaceae bacterium]
MPWLCIDAGTSLIKAVLLDDAGGELAVARQSVSITRPHPNHAEQDMAAVWDAVVKVATEITRQSLAEVEGMVTTAQGDGCWLVDDAGHPVGPAILWNDGRAHEVIESWRREGVIDAAFRRSGSIAYPGLANAVWRWLEEHDPDRLSRARWLLSCNGWLYLQLTGEVSADLSDASNPFCDIVERAYSPELLQLYGVEQLRHLLPEISSRQTPVAALRPSVADMLGVSAGIPVVMAPYDIVTTAMGSGCIKAGDGCVILGTTICPEVITTNSGRDGSPAGTTIALNDPALYLRAMPTLTGCEALDWATTLLQIDDLDHLSSMAEASVAGAHGVVCLPYLSPAGERSPFLAPSACATLHRLSLTHTRGDVARAIFEGLSFVVRDCFMAASAAPLARVAACGGGSRSEFWCQLIADVCECKVLRPYGSEIGVRGAFFSALCATGQATSMENAVLRYGVDGQLYLPAPGQSSAYRSLFANFVKLRQTLAGTWQSQ